VPEGIYVAIDDNQQGPFKDEEIQQMLAAGRINSRSLGWKEGMGDWAPLKTWYAPAQATAEPPPMPGEPPMVAGAPLDRKGEIAFYVGVGGIMAWIVLLMTIGVLSKSGHESEGVMVFFGLLVFAMIGVNLVGVVLGTIAIMGTSARSQRAVIGLVLSALQIAGIIAIMALGSSHPSAH
jgi:hypothetical protein